MVQFSKIPEFSTHILQHFVFNRIDPYKALPAGPKRVCGDMTYIFTICFVLLFVDLRDLGTKLEKELLHNVTPVAK